MLRASQMLYWEMFGPRSRFPEIQRGSIMKSSWRFALATLLASALLGGAFATTGHAQSSWEHFLCYRIDPHGAFKSLSVKLKDQFHKYEAVVVNPVSLCNPVSKNGEGIQDSDRHLVCYEIRADPIGKFPNTIDVNTSNQFTEQSMTAVLPPRTLCVPSKKEIRK